MNTLFTTLNIKPNDTSLYDVAFTHSSSKTNDAVKKDYEKLEFMGDAVINFVVASLIFTHHGSKCSQGQMTKMRSDFVQKAGLARRARQLNLADYMHFGPSITLDEVKNNDRFYEDVFEAFIGAIYLDLGISTATRVVTSLFDHDIINYSFSERKDYKSQLQEEIQASTRDEIVYRVIKEKGPSHNKEFEVGVYLDNICLGVGKGKSKKEAEQAAAHVALLKKAG